MSRPTLSRPALAWASYDFANSAFVTSVLSVIFNVYFARSVVPKEGAKLLGMTIPGEALWGYLVSSVMAVVLIAAPVLGSRADRRGTKRRSLAFWALSGSAATLALFWATPGRLGYALMLAFAAILAYEMSLVFYNAFLTDVSDDALRGRASGFGFALGYIGGGACLALNLWMLAKPGLFGLAGDDATLPVRACIAVAGAWWLIFSLPSILILRDRPGSTGPATATFSQLRRTAVDIFKRRDLGRMLLSYLIYDDGIQTVILMASIFGAKALGMSASELAGCYLMIQFVAFLGAMVAGRLADALGHKKVVVVTLVIFLAATLWGATITTPREFWILGVVVGLVLGGAQAASRSLYSLLVPPHRAGEFFAAFSVVGKAASLVGPFVFGVAAHVLGLRPAVAVIGVFFVVGGAVLLTVDEARGRAAASLDPGENPIR